MLPGSRRLGAWRRFRRLKTLYDVQQNPTFALSAYEIARDFGVEPPEWVLGYFDLVAEGVTVASKRKLKKDDIAPTLVRAFGFRQGGVELQHKQWLFEIGFLPESPRFLETDGARNPLDPDRDRDLRIADDVRIRVDENTRKLVEQGGPLTKKEKIAVEAKAKQAAAQRFGLDVSTIRRALRDYRSAPSPVVSMSDDLRVCMRAGMTAPEAVLAVAGERGIGPAAVQSWIESAVKAGRLRIEELKTKPRKRT